MYACMNANETLSEGDEMKDVKTTFKHGPVEYVYTMAAKDALLSLIACAEEAIDNADLGTALLALEQAKDVVNS